MVYCQLVHTLSYYHHTSSWYILLLLLNIITKFPLHQLKIIEIFNMTIIDKITQKYHTLNRRLALRRGRIGRSRYRKCSRGNPLYKKYERYDERRNEVWNERWNENVFYEIHFSQYILLVFHISRNIHYYHVIFLDILSATSFSTI